MAMTYIQAIGVGFPNVQCHSPGEGDVYEDIIWDSGFPLPSKETLDQWILSNENSVSSDKKITVLAFRKRFTISEKVKLEFNSSDSNDSQRTSDERVIAATLRVIMKDMEAALFIDLDDPETMKGLYYMEQNKIIAAGRSNEILNTPIKDSERPITLSQ